MRIGRLARHQRGATAIEYAIIAGLIGLGLVGSLVATRGSLTTTIGTASNGMSQSMASHPTPPASSRASYWSAKTLVSMVPSNVSSTGGTYTYTYSDGMVVAYTVGWKPDGSFNGESIEIRTRPMGYNPMTDTLVVNANGQTTQISHYEYYNYTQNVSSVRYASGNPADASWPGNAVFYTQQGQAASFCRDGQCYSATLSERNTAAQDPLYFRGLAAQM